MTPMSKCRGISSHASSNRGTQSRVRHELAFEDGVCQKGARSGLSALTMKRLASEVGVALNTLYSAIGSKAELLSGLIDAGSGEILNVSGDSECWDHALIHLCTSVHESLPEELSSELLIPKTALCLINCRNVKTAVRRDACEGRKQV